MTTDLVSRLTRSITPEDDLRDWDSSAVLYRLAKEHVRKAERYALEAGSPVRGQQPEVDSCIAALVLVQAALEAWINWTASKLVCR